jgi:four helix bundle protein
MSNQDIKVRCYNFSLKVLKFISSNEIERKYNPIIDQLLRSSTSIGANIIEAKSSSSKREFIKFYEIALKSSNETKYWICLYRDGIKNSTEIKALLNEADEISKIIAASIIKLKKK